MNLRPPTLTFLALLLSVSASTGADTPSKIEQQMTPNEFDSSGLEKLSQDELKFLNEWLNRYGENLKAVPLQSNTETRPDNKPTVTDADIPPQQTTKIEPDFSTAEQEYEKAKAALNAPRELQIKGEFKGWSGDTYFFMTNGEVWQQRTNRRYMKKLDSPKVKIYKTSLGFFEMEVIETGKKVGVKRVKRQ